MVGLSERKVKELRKVLQSKGYIAMQHRTNPDGGSASVLITVLDVWERNITFFKDKHETQLVAVCEALHRGSQQMEGGQENTPHTHMPRGEAPQYPKQYSIEQESVNTLSEASSEGDTHSEHNSSVEVETLKGVKEVSARPPAKTPEWQARPWLYCDVPLSDETYNELKEQNKNTAILAMICWYVSHTKPTTTEGVHKRLVGSWESKVLKAFKLVEGRTPQTLATWAKQYRASQYGSQTASPDLLAQRYAQWLAGNHHPAKTGEFYDWMVGY